MSEFETLERRRWPNDYLVLPDGFEGRSEPDRRSPRFGVSRDELGLLVKRVALAEPRTVLLESDEDGCRFVFRQRSKVFRFPHVITIECFRAGGDASTLAVWSRAKYGFAGGGVNRKRIERWIAAIEMRVGG
jgi:uncharacterized protein (DUF1499 family)